MLLLLLVQHVCERAFIDVTAEILRLTVQYSYWIMKPEKCDWHIKWENGRCDRWICFLQFFCFAPKFRKKFSIIHNWYGIVEWMFGIKNVGVYSVYVWLEKYTNIKRYYITLDTDDRLKLGMMQWDNFCFDFVFGLWKIN